MYVYYIAMKIYVLICINIFSFLYCLCIINMSHHSPTMDFTLTTPKLFKIKLFTILFHKTLHYSYKFLFLSSESVFKNHKHPLIY
jgi:hypothetical protein